MISPRDRRVLAVGTAVIVGLIVLGRAVPALRDWQAAREAEASALTLRLERVQGVVRDFDRNRRLVTETRARLARYDAALLRGPTATAATAQLSELLGDAASSSDAVLGAIQLSADSTAKTTLSRVTARTEVSGTLQSIALFLDALEDGPRLLAVRDLNITAGTQVTSQPYRDQLHATVVVDGVFPTPRRQESRQ